MLPVGSKGSRQALELHFDGVAAHCTIWVNGVLAVRNWCGYTSVYIDMTAYARLGTNIYFLAVKWIPWRGMAGGTKARDFTAIPGW